LLTFWWSKFECVRHQIPEHLDQSNVVTDDTETFLIEGKRSPVLEDDVDFFLGGRKLEFFPGVAHQDSDV
jgi:hypothetical protein